MLRPSLQYVRDVRHSGSFSTLHQLAAAARRRRLTPPCCLVVQNGTPTRWADEVDEESPQQEQQPPAAAAAAADDSDDDGVCAAAALVVLHPLAAARLFSLAAFVPAGFPPPPTCRSYCCRHAGPPPGFEKPSARAAAAAAADALAGSLKVWQRAALYVECTGAGPTGMHASHWMSSAVLRLSAAANRASACLPSCDISHAAPLNSGSASAFMPPTSQVSEEPPVDDPDLSIRAERLIDDGPGEIKTVVADSTMYTSGGASAFCSFLWLARLPDLLRPAFSCFVPPI